MNNASHQEAETTSTNPDARPTAAHPRKRGRWVIVLLVLAIALLGGTLLLLAYVMGVGSRGFTPPQMAAASYTPRDVVGDLGGMKVTIPQHIPRLVEYDGDPGWGEKRQGPAPERTHTSKLASFGFEVRYPDMATLSSPQMWADYKAAKLYDSPWLSISVTSGFRYPGHGFLDRLTQATLPNPDQKPWYAQYEPVASPIPGLDLFQVRGMHPRTGKETKYSAPSGDIYIHRDRQGKVVTRIECRYINGEQTYSGCSQDWGMESHGLRIELEAMYSPNRLPHWQDIQTQVSRMVLGFKAPEAAVSTTDQ